MRTAATTTGHRPGAVASTGRPSAHLDEHSTCTCGQELDACRHAHCPRCGHRVAAPSLLVAA